MTLRQTFLSTSRTKQKGTLLYQALSSLFSKTIVNAISLTYCRLFAMFLHCLLCHLKASFHLFTAQHSKEWNKQNATKKLSNHESVYWEPLSQNISNVSFVFFLWIRIYAIVVQKKRCKRIRRMTMHWAKRQIWTLLNISGLSRQIRPCWSK